MHVTTGLMKFLGADDAVERLPKIRWVHFCDDGTEQNYPYEPDNFKTLCVKITSQTAHYVDEETRTFDNGDEPAPPPKGRGWIRAIRSNGNPTP
jgi:hypothetical protein